MKQNKQEQIKEKLYQLIDSVRTNGAYPAESFIPEIISQYEEDIISRVLDLVDEHQDAWQKTYVETKSEQQPLEVIIK